jgi:MFS superfamily sulfate permease-like transporter
MFSSEKLTSYFKLEFSRDFSASITVFLVALPLCLGISMASGAPLYSGLVAGIIGGIIVPIISRSSLSVSGPAAGLTAICFSAVQDLGSFDLFLDAVFLAGLVQLALGFFKLGKITHFFPASVIKGMLFAIGVILIFKQIPFLLGYTSPEFWSKEFINIVSLTHVFSSIKGLYAASSLGSFVLAIVSLSILILWRSPWFNKLRGLPVSFVVVLIGMILGGIIFPAFPRLALQSDLFVTLPDNVFTNFSIPDFSKIFSNYLILKYGLLLGILASLETLLSVQAIDKLDTEKRISPPDRELFAQGVGNIFSALLGGLPITAVIVRSSANMRAGGKTRLSSVLHGVWLLLAITMGLFFINKIPYSVLAALLIFTGLQLAKPSLIYSVYRQGHNQWIPFIVTIVGILLTDLLIGVIFGLLFSLYFILKASYEAGFIVKYEKLGNVDYYHLKLSHSVSYLSKKSLNETLEKIPKYAVIDIDGSESTFIDHDILEIISEFKSKANYRKIQVELVKVPEVDILEE